MRKLTSFPSILAPSGHVAHAGWAPLIFGLITLFLGCGYRLASKPRLPGSASGVYIERPDVSRGGDPLFAADLRRALVLESRRRGIDLRPATDADLVLGVSVLSGSVDETILKGDRAVADQLEVSVVAIARSRSTGRAVWRSGRLAASQLQPLGNNAAEAEHRWRAARRQLAARIAARVVRELAHSGY